MLKLPTNPSFRQNLEEAFSREDIDIQDYRIIQTYRDVLAPEIEKNIVKGRIDNWWVIDNDVMYRICQLMNHTLKNYGTDLYINPDSVIFGMYSLGNYRTGKSSILGFSGNMFYNLSMKGFDKYPHFSVGGKMPERIYVGTKMIRDAYVGEQSIVWQDIV